MGVFNIVENQCNSYCQSHHTPNRHYNILERKNKGKKSTDFTFNKITELQNMKYILLMKGFSNPNNICKLSD